jgi:hypothetical protein
VRDQAWPGPVSVPHGFSLSHAEWACGGGGGWLGSGTFVVCIVVSIIAFSHKFSVTRRPFIRDVVMYIGAVSYLLGMLVRRERERERGRAHIHSTCVHTQACALTGRAWNRWMAWCGLAKRSG